MSTLGTVRLSLERARSFAFYIADHAPRQLRGTDGPRARGRGMCKRIVGRASRALAQTDRTTVLATRGGSSCK